MRRGSVVVLTGTGGTGMVGGMLCRVEVTLGNGAADDPERDSGPAEGAGGCQGAGDQSSEWRGGSAVWGQAGDIRKLAAKIKTDDKLAGALWGTGNLDAQLLAILILTPKKVTRAKLDEMVRG